MYTCSWLFGILPPLDGSLRTTAIAVTLSQCLDVGLVYVPWSPSSVVVSLISDVSAIRAAVFSLVVLLASNSSLYLFEIDSGPVL